MCYCATDDKNIMLCIMNNDPLECDLLSRDLNVSDISACPWCCTIFSLINKCHSLLIFSAALEYSKRSFLDNVLYKRADGVDSLIATLDSVKAIADNNDDIKLVILDR